MGIWCSDCGTQWRESSVDGFEDSWKLMMTRYWDPEDLRVPKILPYGTLTNVPTFYRTFGPDLVTLCCCLSQIPFEVILLLYNYVTYRAVINSFQLKLEQRRRWKADMRQYFSESC
jgi:hypothetical protein